MWQMKVAPFTGAWIETMSLHCPSRIQTVAPFTGAWIETKISAGHLDNIAVAPFTGAWIETLRNMYKNCGRLLFTRPAIVPVIL